MTCCLCTRGTIISLTASLAVIGSLAFALPAQDTKKAPTKVDPPAAPSAPAQAQPEGMQLPPGMTMEMLQAYTEASTTGPMHKHLAAGVGVWNGVTKHWMSPEMTEPMVSSCTATITEIMDGKFVKTEISGDMGGMPFLGMGINGYDNISKTFQANWIDNMGTGMMQGTGALSPDGKVMTWNFSFHCPITKKPAVMREVDTSTGPDSMKLEMFGPDPKTGKEFKMMEIAFTRSGKATAAANTTGAGQER